MIQSHLRRLILKRNQWVHGKSCHSGYNFVTVNLIRKYWDLFDSKCRCVTGTKTPYLKKKHFGLIPICIQPKCCWAHSILTAWKRQFCICRLVCQNMLTVAKKFQFVAVSPVQPLTLFNLKCFVVWQNSMRVLEISVLWHPFQAGVDVTTKSQFWIGIVMNIYYFEKWIEFQTCSW